MPNQYSGGFSINPYGEGGGLNLSPYSQQGFSTPNYSAGSIGKTQQPFGTEGIDPVSASLNAIGGLANMIQNAKNRKRKEKWSKEQQGLLSDKFTKLFPEFSREQMTFSNPNSNPYQAFIMQRMQNLGSGWGMPKGNREGGNQMDSLFASLFQDALAKGMPPGPAQPIPGPPMQGKGVDIYGGGMGMGGGNPYGMGGGSPMVNMSGRIPAYATGGIITQPQIAMVGEQGPEAIVPLSRPQDNMMRFRPNWGQGQPQRRPWGKSVAQTQPRQMASMAPPRPPQRPMIQPYNPLMQTQGGPDLPGATGFGGMGGVNPYGGNQGGVPQLPWGLGGQQWQPTMHY
jgi:hypothetical protein